MSDQVFYTDKQQVKAAFEKAATSYDSAAVLQREVATRMNERLDLIKLQPSVILDAGSGTGFGAEKLRQRYPQAHIVELDLAHAMLQTSQAKQRDQQSLFKKWFGAKQTSYIGADIEALPLQDNSVDLIWSNLAIQWVNEPEQAFQEMHRVLKPGGLLMFATLGPDTLKELRQVFQAHLPQSTHVNQFIDMHDLGDALLKTGFELPVMDMEPITLTYQHMKQIMRDLKAIGAHNVTLGRRRGLMGKHIWQKLETAYEQFRHDSVLPASYEVVYGHAWKRTTTPQTEQVIQFYPKQPKTPS